MDRLNFTIQSQDGDSYPLVAAYVLADGTRHRCDGSVTLDPLQFSSSGLSPVEYGLKLGQAVFQGDLADLFVQALSDRSDKRLRVILSVEDPALRTLRWERLSAPFADADGKAHWHSLAVDRRTPFSLSPPTAVDSRFPPVQPQDWRALVLAASPDCPDAQACAGQLDCPDGLEAYNLRPFCVAEAVRSVSDALREAGDTIVPCDVLAWKIDGDLPTLSALKAALIQQPYAFLHIVCHGQVSKDEADTILYLADERNCVQPVAGSELIRQLSLIGSDLGLPNLIFLSSCQTATSVSIEKGALPGLAERLVRELGIPAVIAMTDSIEVKAAQDLARCFYASLRTHGEVDRALADARQCVDSEREGQALIPALYSRFGERPLFSLIEGGKPLTSDEKRRGRAVLGKLITVFAPVLQPRFDALAWPVDRNGSKTASTDPKATLLALNALTVESFNLRFDQLVDVDLKAVLNGKRPDLIPLKVKDRQAISPFRGLEAFREEDSAFFFGREDLIRRLDERLDQHRFLPLLGPSGCGKSSLVLAGLLPYLRRKKKDLSWGSRPVRPGPDPVAALEAHLRDCPNPDLIVVDQFEEVFSLCHAETKRREFFARLLELTETVRVILTMRADFWGDCAPYEQLREAMQAHQMLIPPMTPAELRRATEEQAAAVGLRLEPGLGATIFADVAEEPGTMPLLQYALLELWNRRHGLWLRMEEYQAIGGAKGAIASRADALFAGLSDPKQPDILSDRQRRVRDIFVRLTKIDDVGDADQLPRDTRRRVPMSQLVPADEDATVTRELVEQLAAARLVVTGDDDLTGEPEVEVAHEALIRSWEKLRIWLDENRAGLILLTELETAASDWQENRQEKSYLAGGSRLIQFETLVRAPAVRLNRLEEDYLRLSRQRQTDVDRRNRNIVAVIAFLAVAAAIAAVLAWRQRGEAITQSQIALARSLSAQAVGQHDIAQDVRGALMAAQAFRFNQDGGGAAMAPVDGALRSVLGIDNFSRLFPGPKFPVRSMAFSPIGQILATGGPDGTTRLWDLQDPTAAPQLLSGQEGEGPVISVAFSPDGQHLASTSPDATRLWDLSDPSNPIVLPSLDEGQGWVQSVAFSPDGKTLATGSYGAVRLWDVHDVTAEPVALPGQEGKGWIKDLAFTPDGLTLAGVGEDGAVRFWNPHNTGAEPEVLPPQTGEGPVTSLAFSPDSLSLATVYLYGNVYLWQLADLDVAPVSLPHEEDNVFSAAFSPDGQTLATGNGAAVRLWDLGDLNAPPIVLRGVEGEGGLTRVAFTADGEIVAGFVPFSVRLWHLNDLASDETVLTGHRDWVQAVAFSPDGLTLASGGKDGTDRLWNTRDLAADPIIFGREGESGILSLAFAPDGQTLAAGSLGTVRLWNARDPTTPTVLPAQTDQDWVDSLAFHPDGNTLAANGEQGGVRIWYLPGPTEAPIILPRTNRRDSFTALAFSPDGETLAISKSDGTVQLRQSRDPVAEPVILPAPDREISVRALAYSPDGLTLATGYSDTATRLWDLRDVTAAPTVLPGQEGEGMIQSVAFSPDGKILATGSYRGTVRLWNLLDLTAAPTVIAGNGGAIYSVAFSPDGRTVATGNADGSVRLWVADAALLQEMVCQMVWRNLTIDEWQRFVGRSAPYESTCSNLPPGEGAPGAPGLEAASAAPP
jgi:WD40 repeat protein